MGKKIIVNKYVIKKIAFDLSKSLSGKSTYQAYRGH